MSTPTIRMVLGALLAATGAALFIWAQMARGGARRTSPLSPGAGLPESFPLLSGGPYALCRHPLLLGALCLLAGVGLLKEPSPDTIAVLAGLAVVAIVLSLFEERTLMRQHGAAYRQYRLDVPFLIPGLRLPRRPGRP
ncbi:MAG: methyltransferase family protein [Candidatus Dormibacteria bacterium]